MPYTIDSYDGSTFTFTISDGTVDSTNTSLKLLGQNYAGYGEIVAEDFVHLLESFAKTTAPSNPIHGQIWYDKSTGSGAANKGYKLKYYDSASSSWKMVANLVASTSAPSNPSVGDLWWDETTGEKIVKLWDGTVWQGISVPSDTNYTIRFVKIYDDYGAVSTDPGVYNCIELVTEGFIVAIINLHGAQDTGPVDRLGFKPLTTAGTFNGTAYTTELDTDGSTLSTVFPVISPGITLRSEHGSAPVRRPVIGNFSSNGIEDKVATLNSVGRPIITPIRAVEISTASGAAEANQSDLTVAQNQYALKIKSTANASSATGNDSSGAALQVLGGASIAKNLYIGGNFEVEGTTSGTLTEINSESFKVVDPITQFGRGADDAALTTQDEFDRGFSFFYHNSTAEKIGGFAMDKTDNYKFNLVKEGTVTTNAFSAVAAWADIKLGNIEGHEATMTIDSKVGDMTVITSGTDKHINVTANGAGTIKTSGDILPQEVTTDVSSNDIGGASNYFSEGYAVKTFWNTACHFDGTNKANASVIMTGDYNLAAGSTLEATYADLGERFASDEIYEAGTVVKLGGLEEITKTMEEEDTDVFGIISAKPGFGLNGLAGPKETHPHVAMTGRIPCKVIGPVKKGDRLCSSEIPGVAKRADIQSVSSFAIIGRALEDFDDEGEGTVLVVVGPIN
jgi:hypothetical protein